MGRADAREVSVQEMTNRKFLFAFRHGAGLYHICPVTRVRNREAARDAAKRRRLGRVAEEPQMAMLDRARPRENRRNRRRSLVILSRQEAGNGRERDEEERQHGRRPQGTVPEGVDERADDRDEDDYDDCTEEWQSKLCVRYGVTSYRDLDWSKIVGDIEACEDGIFYDIASDLAAQANAWLNEVDD